MVIKSFMGLFSLVMIVCFSQSALVNAMKETPYIITEEGIIIGIAPPTIEATQSKSLKNLTENAFINYMITNSENSAIETITIVPSLYGSTIEIPLEFKNGEYLVLYQDDNGKTFNAENIYNKEHKSIGVITTKAVENSEKVKITSKIKGSNTIVLYVNSNDLSEAFNIEVVITASTYLTYFSKGEWVNRGGIESLSLTHNPFLISADNDGEAGVKKKDAWDKVLYAHGINTTWSNTEGMKNQFDCHFDFAKNKNPWNIEPARPNKGYFATVIAACNP